jgi:hypothetical protein
MSIYTANDSDVSSSTLFARPSECGHFLNSGQLSIAEYIRHYITLAYAGLWTWSDPDIDEILRTKVGKKFFNFMADLDTELLDIWIEHSNKPTTTIKVFDYATECRLKKLLQWERKPGRMGDKALHQLMRLRGFYASWRELLFKEEEAKKEIERDETVEENSQNGGEASTSVALKLTLSPWYWMSFASLLYFGIFV